MYQALDVGLIRNAAAFGDLLGRFDVGDGHTNRYRSGMTSNRRDSLFAWHYRRGDHAKTGLEDCLFDGGDAVGEGAGGNGEEFEAEVAVGGFVDLFEAEGFIQGDAAGFGGGDKAEAADEEHAGLEDRFDFQAIEFGG